MNAKPRILLLDLSRATAVLAMIFYHFAYDLGDFGYVNMITIVNGSWKLFAQSIGSSFLFISGFSFWIMARNGLNWVNYAKRLTILILAASLISFITYLQFGSAFIFFGILHLLAACSIFSLFIYRLPVIVILVLGALILIAPEYYYSSSYYSESLFEHKYLSWTGLYNGRTGSVDFYAFMPWSAAFVFGMALAKILIKPANSNYLIQLNFKKEKRNVFISAMLWIGKNSLLVYLIHQPLLYGLFYAYGKVAH